MSPGAWSPPPPPVMIPRTQAPSQGLATASMIVGLAGILLSWCFGPVPAIVALVLGLVALSQIKKSPEKFGGKPFATAGVIIGGITVMFYVFFLIWVILSAALR